jgi:predicted  nucleic acid-binding Zn-ribbon protein
MDEQRLLRDEIATLSQRICKLLDTLRPISAEIANGDFGRIDESNRLQQQITHLSDVRADRWERLSKLAGQKSG